MARFLWSSPGRDLGLPVLPTWISADGDSGFIAVGLPGFCPGPKVLWSRLSDSVPRKPLFQFVLIHRPAASPEEMLSWPCKLGIFATSASLGVSGFFQSLDRLFMKCI